MLLEDDSVFKTRRARNDVYEKMVFALRLCDSAEDVTRWKEENFFQLIAIKADDEQHPENEPVYEFLERDIEAHLEHIKRKESEYAFRE